MHLHEILSVALRKGASDVHLKAGMPPMCRLNGTLIQFKGAERISPEMMGHMAASIMNDKQRERFTVFNEVDLSHAIAGIGRFRVNVFKQRHVIGMVFRCIPLKIKTIEELGLPDVLKTIAMETRGMILVVGTTGSGKSTTLAAMLDHINRTQSAHILTIEDPIEYMFQDRRSVVNQREVGVDTMDFGAALKSALRQDPDVILVGEMRDHETTETAMTASETGHLVMSTLHTLDAAETVNRIISIFPPHQQKQVRMQLGAVLRAVVAQRLLPTADGAGRVPALEILRTTPRVRELIEDKDRMRELPDAIADGVISYGMQSFDQSLMKLLKSGRVTFEEAMRNSTNPSNFALRVQGVESTSEASWDAFQAQSDR